MLSSISVCSTLAELTPRMLSISTRVTGCLKATMARTSRPAGDRRTWREVRWYLRSQGPHSWREAS